MGAGNEPEVLPAATDSCSYNLHALKSYVKQKASTPTAWRPENPATPTHWDACVFSRDWVAYIAKSYELQDETC